MQEYNLNLFESEVNTILAALGEMPLKNVIEVFNKIHRQANEQNKKEGDTK